MGRIKHALLTVLLGICFSSYGSLKLADALQNNMVVQQNKPFKIWGKGNPGKKVTIKADWMATAVMSYIGNDGRFTAIIQVPCAKKNDFSKHLIKVSDDETEIVLTNLLIGDVWFCSGQSNMQFSVKEMVGSKEIIEGANKPNIRLLNVGLNFSATPINEFTGKWEVSTQVNVPNFSAVAYVFGTQLYKKLQIPIGLIFSGIGASSVQAYIPQGSLANDQTLDSTYLKPYIESSKSKEKIDGGFSFEKVTRPFLLYNAMIHPFINLSVKGFCWYQGEANHLERDVYIKATQTLITSWRKRFGEGSLPFYFVQIAPYNHEDPDNTQAYDAFFREAQQKITKLNNTEMVCSMDVGDPNDIHPKNKKPIGVRLAAVALNRTYNNLDIPYKGPEYNDVLFKKSKATVYFKTETIYGGLTTNDDKAPSCFYLAGEDKIFHKATAKIVGNHIVLRSRDVKHPIAIRYAFTNAAITNLQNGAGFPALPFRTDEWEETK